MACGWNVSKLVGGNPRFKGFHPGFCYDMCLWTKAGFHG
jgi:hypothetical protein